MFCQNCGEQVQVGSKFCQKCGNQVGQTGGGVKEEQNYTAPKPFQPYSSIDPNQGMVDKTAFKGKQVSMGSSGSVSFKKKPKNHTETGSVQKKKGCLGWMLRLIMIVVILFMLLVGYYMVTDDTGASNVEMDLKTSLFEVV